MKIAFIIRFHYENDDPRFAWRLAYFRNKVFPRIISQGDDFEIAIRCNPVHDEIFRSISPRIRVFHAKQERVEYKRGKYFVDFMPFENLDGFPRYDVQIGLDSDDLIEPGYYAELMEILSVPMRRGESAHVCFQPELIDVKTGEIHRMPQRYNPEKGSAFFAIYQPGGVGPYHFAYEESHLTIGRHFIHRIVSGRENLCFASCHDLNESTHI